MKPEHQHHKPVPPHRQRVMNKVLIAAVIVLIGVIAFILFRPLPTSPLPVPGGPPPPAGPPKLKRISGMVQGYKYNTHLDINAIQINTGPAGSITIEFRPHTAKAVMGVAGLNDPVEINYSSQPNDESVGYQLHRITNTRSKDSVDIDELPPPPRVPPDQSPENFVIKDPALITDQYGGIAAIKSKHQLFHFKPGQVDDISALIKTSRDLKLLAVLRDGQSGFVNAEQDKVYIVISITINNQTFLIR
ncbi:MAG: hypothetical protein M3O71_23070 [Bacteroidota bacterium]|nr:hypothetical protein [Bacteroidota bacterium]